mgnify:FL=1
MSRGLGDVYKRQILENGKYYIDKEIKYLCIRDSGIPLAYENLSDLVSAGYVRVV